eukprot:TRINITY_DN2634_c0_g1_i2.p1 TRINITY_DN2634_c0_g1~~TRINITY_DN2634_c0_g1_i2.p1  ORF type:complete len:692 (+),score=201.18 TRINITY_DN2634_c0_g1_i2:190-2076(+)
MYDSEDSENERELNTIGNVPIEWYEDYDHVGYDLEGKKILKPKGEDAIDRLLNQEKRPWSVYNEKTGQRELISHEDMEYIRQLQEGKEPQRYSAEKWFIQLDNQTDTLHATTQTPEPKSRFIPSKWEAKRIRYLTFAIKKGWIKLETAEQKEPEFFLIWDESADKNKDNKFLTRHIPAPKARVPGHIESYNPPEEYLFDDEERQAWEALDPEDRPTNFIPSKNSSLRLTPGYAKFQRERFERCLDLYLATRVVKKKVWVDPESLVPKLPKPSELKPFPTQQSILYSGHDGLVRCISVDPTGQWIVSGSDDKSFIIWEVATGRQMMKYSFPTAPLHIEWNPNPDLSLIAITTESTLYIFHPTITSNVPQKANTEQFFENVPPNNHNDKVKELVEWKKPEKEEWESGMRLKISFSKASSDLKFVTWHSKGDYFSTVCPKGNKGAVLIHQLSRQQSQNPFTKSKGIVECVRFHPSKPYFFLATQRQIRVYNLAQQKLQKKLITGSKWISSMHIHPGGDNLIMGSYDRRVCWFDLDLGTTPYKILKYHQFAVRSVKFHSKYPLFASASDDGCIHVFHGMVYNDLMQNPFIVPLKVLRGHENVDGLGITDLAFHPTQPWVFSCGADKTIRLYT